MTNDPLSLTDGILPTELQQPTPRTTRLAARGVYYIVGSMVVSMLIVAFAALAISKNADNVKKGRELARDGQLAYTGDVRSGGPHLATVYYTFTCNGQPYHGEAMLPESYLDKIDEYSKSGKFPILYLPRDPQINHPYEWHNDESYSFSLIAYVLIAIVIIQWSLMGKVIVRDLNLARNGVASAARVTKCSYGKNGGGRLRYEFRDMDGILTEGHGDYPVQQSLDAQICILYLPEETEKSHPYPLALFRVVK